MERRPAHSPWPRARRRREEAMATGADPASLSCRHSTEPRCWDVPRPSPPGLFLIRRIVEELRQLDAPVPELREAGRARIPRIEVGGRVVRWKQNERPQELQDRQALLGIEAIERIARPSGFAAVPQDDLRQVDAPTVVSECDLAPDAPESARQEFLPDGSVPVPLGERGPEVVALEVREDVVNEERLELRSLQSRKAAAVVDDVDFRC